MSGTVNGQAARKGQGRGAGILSLPNLLSLSRVLLTPLFVVLMAQRKAWPAFVVFLIAGATDALDGFAARALHQKSELGLWLDPIGDKVLLTAAFVVLTIPGLGRPNALPLGLTVLCIGRDIVIAGSALVLVALRGVRTFKPGLFGKASTICQVFLIYAVLLLNALGKTHAVLPWWYLLTAVLAAASWIQYGVRGVAILRRKSGPTAG